MITAFLCAAALSGCKDSAGREESGDPAIAQADRELYLRAATALKPMHKAKVPGSWMRGPGRNEKGQTFDQYLESDPVKPDEEKGTLYVVLLGEFEGKRRKIVDLCAEFMEPFFNMPVKFLDPLPLSIVPDSARRVHPSWKMRQIHAGYILDEVLPPRLPEDAVALIAFTSSDLYPEESWNFVFGMASLQGRVGVWSIYRFGDPDAGPEQFTLCLKRTIKIGTHETGHMLGIRHCTSFECNMNGSNSIEESDGRPLAMCPDCVRKIWWACKADPVDRYRQLENFCRTHGLKKDADFYKSSRDKIEPVFGSGK